MTPQIAVLIEKIRHLESELDAELAKSRAELRIGMEHGRIAFEQELLRRHRARCGRSCCHTCSAPIRWSC